MTTETSHPIKATCPECRGPLSVSSDALEFRCLVGHRYSPLALLDAHFETQERTLWAAVLVLEETAQLVSAVRPFISGETLDRLNHQVATKLKQAKEIRRVLESLEPFQPR